MLILTTAGSLKKLPDGPYTAPYGFLELGNTRCRQEYEKPGR